MENGKMSHSWIHFGQIIIKKNNTELSFSFSFPIFVSFHRKFCVGEWSNLLFFSLSLKIYWRGWNTWILHGRQSLRTLLEEGNNCEKEKMFLVLLLWRNKKELFPCFPISWKLFLRSNKIFSSKISRIEKENLKNG